MLTSLSCSIDSWSWFFLSLCCYFCGLGLFLHFQQDVEPVVEFSVVVHIAHLQLIDLAFHQCLFKWREHTYLASRPLYQKFDGIIILFVLFVLETGQKTWALIYLFDQCHGVGLKLVWLDEQFLLLLWQAFISPPDFYMFCSTFSMKSFTQLSAL